MLRHRDLLEVLLAAGADADHRDGEGRTPLMWAAIGGDVGIMNVLLEVRRVGVKVAVDAVVVIDAVCARVKVAMCLFCCNALDSSMRACETGGCRHCRN